MSHSRVPRGILGRALHFLSPGLPVPAAALPRDEDRVRAVVARLAGGVAHDLNNILLVVQGYAEMAVEEPDAGPAVRGLLEEMRDATGRASLLVRDLLYVGERGPFTPRVLDLSEIVGRRLPSMASACPDGIELRSSLADGLPPVMADEDLVGRLLEALCARAREAMPVGGASRCPRLPGPAIRRPPSSSAFTTREPRSPTSSAPVSSSRIFPARPVERARAWAWR